MHTLIASISRLMWMFWPRTPWHPGKIRYYIISVGPEILEKFPDLIKIQYSLQIQSTVKIEYHIRLEKKVWNRYLEVAKDVAYVLAGHVRGSMRDRGSRGFLLLPLLGLFLKMLRNE